jgi:hypothetical protein
VVREVRQAPLVQVLALLVLLPRVLVLRVLRAAVPF